MRLVLALLLALAPLAASAQQAWPERPVRIIMGYAAGGVLDVITRAVMEPMRAQLGQPVVIENRPGGAGYVGLEACAQAMDHHTFCAVTVEAMVFHPFAEPELFRRIASLKPVSQFVRSPGVVLASPELPVEDLRGFASWARGRGQALNYGSFGPGSTPHIFFEWLKASARLEIEQVPFRSAAEMLNEVATGRVQVGYNAMGYTLPQIRAGRVKVLAVLGNQRQPALPEVPSMAELGFDYPYAGGWFGLMAPASATPEQRARMAEGIRAVVHDPAFQARVLAPQAYEAIGNNPAEFTAVLQQERAQGERLARMAGFIR